MCRFRASAGLAALGRSATLAAAIALSACGGGDEDEVSLPPPSEFEKVRPLRLGEFSFASRPARCARTRVVIIAADGTPRPRNLRLDEGACFLWGNASHIEVTVRYAPGAQGALGRVPTDASVRLSPNAASTTRGPLTVLTRRKAVGVSGVAQAPFSFRSEGVSEEATLAFYPARARSGPVRCPSRALRTSPAMTPARLAYTVEPGGAKGTVILDRSFRTPDPAAGRIPRGLEAIRSLACGKLTLAERPAGCRVTRAVVIAGRRPRPRELRLPRAASCVVWGNRDRSEAGVRFGKRLPAGTVTDYRRLWPSAAAAWDFFFGSSPGRLIYTVEPGGAKGAILIE